MQTSIVERWLATDTVPKPIRRQDGEDLEHQHGQCLLTISKIAIWMDLQQSAQSYGSLARMQTMVYMITTIVDPKIDYAMRGWTHSNVACQN